MEIAPDVGTPTVQLADATATAVWRAHDDAARLLGVAAGTPPPDLDAGVASPGLEAAVDALGATTSDLARLNRLLAQGVRGARADLGITDDDVRARFHAAAGTLPWDDV